ncbi:hypothetical protein KUTeg_016006 [Tegillarca granosa]|uniref:Uncharacterized protein n=1 Tax=Tegillarca granosa TaxID=220873 RepID=A0ABQ9EM53_TEGGR|nr:hypothetical protein KUTeg_016006 [Tegillarca granosa]
MQVPSALSKNDQCNYTCPQFKRIKKETKDESSGCNNEEIISCLSMDDEVPKIYIDEFVDPGIAYEEGPRLAFQVRYLNQKNSSGRGYDMQNPPIFETGQILEEIGENERRNDVIKYGAESGLTRGALNS